ncbi:hypothetical protein BDZ97DRAFT_1781237 [Flammula alnicola]|nr:hypothetical protein BDZ97DRAFT_1781237 [Flammula alnicola]
MHSFLHGLHLGAGREEGRRPGSSSDSEGSISRHSSIQGPYREGMSDTSFPVYRTVETPDREAETYARSLLPLGNGFGLYNIEGNLARPKEHLEQGALIGDVGYILPSDVFDFCFNVFCPLNHAIQPHKLPQNFSVAYPEEQAVAWYQYFNGDSESTCELPTANGTIWIVTGVDRVKSWALATFPAEGTGTSNSGKYTRFTYDGDSDKVWEWNSKGKNRPRFRLGSFSDSTLGPIFIRVLAVALSPSQWSSHVRYVPPNSSLGVHAWALQALARIRGSAKPTSESPEKSQCFFYPSIILLHILLLTDPSAVVGIVADSVWLSQLSEVSDIAALNTSRSREAGTQGHRQF